MQKWRNIFFLFAVSCLLIVPAIIKGIPRGNDLEHHYRTSLGLYHAIEDKQIIPGWNSLPTDGYGDVSFRFYPPLFYYIMCSTRALTGDWYSGSCLAFILLLFTGALGVYWWARSFLAPNHAFCAGLFFLFAPYHLNQLYQASMLGEFAGCAFLPFSFALVERICQTGKRRYVIGLAMAYAVLVLTHLPLTVLGSFALGIYTLFRIPRSDRLKIIIRLALAVTLGLAASSFYWVTMITELAWMRGNKVNPQLWYDYRYNFLFGEGVDGSTSWWATIQAGATLLTVVPAIVLLKKRRSAVRNQASPLLAILVVTAVSFFMMVPLSRPIWDRLACLQQVEFPWRWLAVSAILCPVLAAASIPGWLEVAKTGFRPLALAAAGCLLISGSFTISQIIRGATFLKRSGFEAKIESIATTPSSSDMLPFWASENPQTMAKEIESQNRQAVVTLWQAKHRTFQIDAGVETEARAKTFYYPLWRATAAGKSLQTRPAEDGALLISLPDQATVVELNFCEPSRTALANDVSLIAWLGFLASGLLMLCKRLAQVLSSEIGEAELWANTIS
jgi:hypothetical protein